MENRRNRRTPAMVKILLFKDGLPVAIGRTRDISGGGLFVQSDYTEFDSLRPMQMELLSNSSTLVSGSSRHRAFVVHWSADGFGLRFDDSNEVEHQAMVAAIEKSLSSNPTSALNDRVAKTKGILRIGGKC